MLQGIVVLCQLIFFPDICRHILPFHLPNIQSLGHSSGDGFISQTLCLSVDRLHAHHHGLIAFSGKDLRLFHGQTVILLYDLAIEYVAGAGLKNAAKKRHVIPGQLQGAGSVF